MKYRILGGSGLRVSVVGMGTWQFGGEWGKTFEQSEVDAMFAAARDEGINLIDTAECYGDHTSEAFIGQALKNISGGTGGDRSQWVIATKFGHKFHEPFKRDTIYDPKLVLEQLEGSLRALQTDYIDLYQFHSGNDEQFDTDGLWETLQKQVEAGKVRHLGISIGSNDNIYQTDRASALNAKTIQVVYNRLDRKPEERVFPSCVRQNLGVLARVPLASGYLSGKYKPDAKFPQNDVRTFWHKEEDRRRKLEEVERIAKTEVPAGVPMAQWALAWCLQHEAVTCVIPGCKDVQQVKDNAAAAKLDLVRADHPQAA